MGRLIIELLASHGKSVERRYIFEKGHAAIGRSYKNDVILDDPFLSPEHLFISASGGSVQVTDLKSENGTKINGRAAIKDQTEKAASGDQITIGRTKLKIILPGQPVAPALSVDRFTTFLQSLGRWRLFSRFSRLVWTPGFPTLKARATGSGIKNLSAFYTPILAEPASM